MKMLLIATLGLGLVGCTTVREVSDHDKLPVNGEAQKVRTDDALAYNVAIQIDAPPSAVWSVLVDAPSYTSWNSTVKSLDGEIKLNEKIDLVVHDAPDRTFSLKVSEMKSAGRMVWEDGGSMFLGVRTFTLRASEGGTVFTMEEVFSGGMLGMIEDSLPDFRKSFAAFAADLKKRVEPEAAPAAPEAPAPETDASEADAG